MVKMQGEDLHKGRDEPRRPTLFWGTDNEDELNGQRLENHRDSEESGPPFLWAYLHLPNGGDDWWR